VKILTKDKKLNRNHTNKDYENLGNVAEYSLNDKFRSTLVNLFETYKDAGGTDDKLVLVQKGLDNTKNVLVQNIVGLTERDEKLDSLLEKTQEMTDESYAIKKTSKKVKNTIKWRSYLVKAGFLALALVLIYMLIAMFCGFDFQQCTSSNNVENSQSVQAVVEKLRRFLQVHNDSVSKSFM